LQKEVQNWLKKLSIKLPLLLYGIILNLISSLEACGRCHANRYGKLTQLGEIPKTKANIKTGQDIDRMKYAKK